MVIAEQDEERLVDDRRVAELVMRRPGAQGRVAASTAVRVAEPGVLGTVLKLLGTLPSVPDRRAGRLGPRHRAEPGLLGPERSRGVDLRPGDVAVDVHPRRHHDVPPSVDRPIRPDFRIAGSRDRPGRSIQTSAGPRRH